MKLTLQDDPRAIRRYAHIKPVRRPGAERCPAMCPGAVRTCTRAKGHGGPHVSHGMFGRVLAVWDRDHEVRGASGALTAGGGRRPLARPLHVRALDALVDRVLALGSDVETVVFLVMFVAFVGFALYWVTLIFGSPP